MKPIYRLLLLLLVTTVQAGAQDNPVKISGRITGPNSKPVEGATVSLLHAGITTAYKTSVTDSNGMYSIEHVPGGTYILRITAVDFSAHRGDTLVISTQKEFIVPVIQLQPDIKKLAEVSVEGHQSYTEEKIDRTVVNVNALISNNGVNALEVLGKIPGVQVDGSGAITFRGKAGVMVLIDDKPTYLSGASLATYLRSLPASSLDKIELMDIPPARYDASGSAGAINIKMKKSTTQGLNGNFASSFEQGFYGRTTESLNLNYRINKINLFSNLSYSVGHGYDQLELGRNYYTASGALVTAFSQSAYSSPAFHNLNLLTGIDYYLSKNTTWGIVFNEAHLPSKTWQRVTDVLTNGMGGTDSIINANNHSDSRFDKQSANVNFTHRFGKPARLLTFDLDYINYRSDNDQSYLDNVYLPGGVPKDSQYTIDTIPSRIDIYAAKVDYSLPLKDKSKIDAGVKSSYVNIDNLASYYNVINNIALADYNKTNHFLYRENINAAYLSYSNDFKRFSVKAGLRLEVTGENGHQLGNAQRQDSAFSTSYTRLFPTAYFLYKLDTAGHHTLSLAAGRRIVRPNYQDLNPFITLVDQYTYNSGNPFLKPQFNENLVVSYHYKNKFTAAFSYDYATDILIGTIHQQGNIFINERGNIGERHFMSTYVSLNEQPVKCWSFTLYIQFSHNHYSGILNNGPLDETSNWITSNMTNQFNFSRGWSAELSGNYTARAAVSQFINLPVGLLNAAIQKKVLQNKGSLKLSANDVFKTFHQKGSINNIPDATGSFYERYDSRAIILGFTYSFGRQKTPEKRKTGAADTEIQRTNN